MLKKPYPKEVYVENAHVYKLLANAKRLEILNSVKSAEATVKEIASSLGISSSNASQHLAILSYMNLIKSRREGRNVFYKLADKRIVEPCRVFKRLREQRLIPSLS